MHTQVNKRNRRKKKEVFVDEDVWAGEVLVWADIFTEEKIKSE